MINELTITMGEFELIHSVSVILVNGIPLKIKIPDEVEGDFTFIFNIITDKVNPESFTKYKAIDKYTINIDLVNVDGLVGGGNKEILKMGTLRNLPLFLNYRLFDLPEAGKTLILNFYVRKEESHGY